MGGIIRRKAADAAHLDYKKQGGPQSLAGCPLQLPDVFHAPLCGSVRKTNDPILFQRNALDLYQMQALLC